MQAHATENAIGIADRFTSSLTVVQVYKPKFLHAAKRFLIDREALANIVSLATKSLDFTAFLLRWDGPFIATEP
jgi:hypothetical protein